MNVAGTHLIQDVIPTIIDDAHLLNLVIRFAEEASIWGAQVALVPTVLNRTTCEAYIRTNFRKTSDTITESVSNISRGIYNLTVHVVENDGSLNTNMLANRPQILPYNTAGE
jgi:hypothetical protein